MPGRPENAQRKGMLSRLRLLADRRTLGAACDGALADERAPAARPRGLVRPPREA